ncbi:MAG TPA: tRNA pseudouridine(38-40) synthase TruA [Syntrophorhabdales bacterium]|nr:tRNA pseudouridine(38-40) synthase TruA [Syntrophorhabdales bacterium]
MEYSSEFSRNIRLTLAYDGTNYHGWQSQPNGVTVEETLKGAAERIVDHRIKIVAGGRTDAGVHALGQVASFTTSKPIDARSLCRGINSLLPPDIRVKEASDVGPDFHARYSAKSKVYIYCILNQRCNSPFLARYALHVPFSIDTAAMGEASGLLVGEHDFSAFKKKDEVYANPVREVKRARVATRGHMVFVVVEATGFLRYMVRNIVGTLLLVGRQKIDKAAFQEILESKQRENAGPTAPPHGLFLKVIKY